MHISADVSLARACGELEGQVTDCLMQAEVAEIVVLDTLSYAELRVTADQAMAVMHAVCQLIADVQYYEYLESDTKGGAAMTVIEFPDSKYASEAAIVVASMEEEVAQRTEKNSELCLQMEEPIRDAALMAKTSRT